jgi:hypothetical protein
MRGFGLWVLGLVGCAGSGTVDEPADTTTAPEVSVAGHCMYTNTFSRGPECKEYTGAGWDETSAAADCAAPMVGADPGQFTAGAACDVAPSLGRCEVAGEGDDAYALVFPGDDAGSCSGVQLGCGFANGEFIAAGACLGQEEAPPSFNLPVFRPFEQVCVDVPVGEEAGTSAGGQVCTWEAISACTEPGRDYIEFASCDTVLTQRPYVPYDVPFEVDPADPRLADQAYMAELAWVKDEVESCACICCHSSEHAPEGASGWYIEAGPLWLDTLDDDGLAMLAGWVDSTAFGAFPPAENNGFDRSTTGIPTSDVARMQAFLVGELARRGLDRDDFATTEPFGGPLYDQIVYEPSACAAGQGVGADGTVTWTGGAARYVYVLEADASSPGVPPNLDLPEGTLWRVDVAPDDAPISSGITYGVTPAGAVQRYPVEREAASLVPGQTYYLYVLRDIYQPLTRCLFTR